MAALVSEQRDNADVREERSFIVVKVSQEQIGKPKRNIVTRRF